MAVEKIFQGGGTYVAIGLSTDERPEGEPDALFIEQDTGLVHRWGGATWGASDVLLTATASLAADVAIGTANTWVDGPQITIGPGTWLVMAHATILRNTTTAMFHYARIANAAGTVFIASGEANTPSVANQASSITLSALVTSDVQAGVKIQATASQTATLKAALHANGSGNNATRIDAIRVR